MGLNATINLPKLPTLTAWIFTHLMLCYPPELANNGMKEMDVTLKKKFWHDAVSRIDGRNWLHAHVNQDLEVQYWHVDSRDTQSTHDRDELYFVVEGNGTIEVADKKHDVSAGDVVPVPAGVYHRFVEASSDLAMWVIFYGAYKHEDK